MILTTDVTTSDSFFNFPLTLALRKVIIDCSSGEYATESEVIWDGLRTLQAGDAALEKWLHDQVIRSYDDCEADATLGVPAAQIMARIRSQYHKRTTEEQR